MPDFFQPNPRIVYELDNLPEHFHDIHSKDFLLLIAALQAHDLPVIRADERWYNNEFNDLWLKMGHPSVMFEPSSYIKLLDALRKETPGTPEYTKYSNKMVRANLILQQKLLALLEEFYTKHTAPFYARLVIENLDLGQTYLKSQGSNTWILLKDKELKKKRLKESQNEFGSFMAFLCTKAHELDLQAPKS